MPSHQLARQAMCISGDPEYPHSVHLQRPFQYGLLTQEMQNFNGSMSKVCSSVEKGRGGREFKKGRGGRDVCALWLDSSLCLYNTMLSSATLTFT